MIGSPGCGKSECIKTLAVAQMKRGKHITVQSIFTRAVERDELLGHYDESTRYFSITILSVQLLLLLLSYNSNSLFSFLVSSFFFKINFLAFHMLHFSDIFLFIPLFYWISSGTGFPLLWNIMQKKCTCSPKIKNH